MGRGAAHAARPSGGKAVADLEGFREETRSWLEEHCPASKRGPQADTEEVWGGRRVSYKNPDSKLWLERMSARGWTAPTWPKEYAGGGLSQDEAKILQQEMQRLRCRLPLISFGISMLGPVLLEFGNEEQKREYLPKIVRGETRWCQGYSEPGAGSDLASLQMRAVLDGDEYVVNGQKIWTSYADKSDWIFCLVRTGPDTPKHDGISFLLIDMASPGVSTTPIRLISGYSPFCQTFLEDVRVPKQNLVGPLNGGWTIAKRLLQFERSVISEGFGVSPRKRSLEELARRYLDCPSGTLPDSLLRSRVAQQIMEDECFRLTLKRSAEETKAGQGPGPASSMFKYYGTELNKQKYELMLSLLGMQGLGWEGEGFEPEELVITREWLRSKGNSIEGGTSEIQLNIIAKRVLGLPD
ncbi:MAG: acyl-CoA dehydrogenase [Deltaproteobacteria bacterium]|nr:MAG: acyl-CoA dehydrogenase [Deltaproteobacteria bacterium]